MTMYKTVSEAFDIDINEYKDCYIQNPFGDYVTNPFTNENLLDYEVLRDRITAEKLNCELDIAKGKYIEKSYVENLASYFNAILSSSADSVCYKYFSSIIALIDAHCENEISTIQQSELKNRLHETTLNIFADARKKTEEFK